MPVLETGGAYAPTGPGAGREIDIPLSVGDINTPRPFVEMENRRTHPNHTVRPDYMPKLVRGHMTRWERTGREGDYTTVGGKKVRFHFTMNPQSVDVGYNIDPAMPMDEDIYAADQKNVPVYGTANINFSLMVDRSYEVLDKNPKWYQPTGVLEDIKVLEALLAPGFNVDTDIAAANYVQVVFGGGGGGRRAMEFFGQLMGVNVSLVHHTHEMVPTRAVVNVSLRRQSSKVTTQAPGFESSGVGVLTPAELEALKAHGPSTAPDVPNPYGGGVLP